MNAMSVWVRVRIRVKRTSEESRQTLRHAMPSVPSTVRSALSRLGEAVGGRCG